MKTKRWFVFAERNIKEILRDPVVYIFGLLFPLLMLGLFFAIGRFAPSTSVFKMPSLVPGIILFSFSFLMLSVSLLVSGDRATAFLTRLYCSPMRPGEFIAGYFLPGVLLGVMQEIICLIGGAVLAAVAGERYFSFGRAVLLSVWMLPVLATFLCLGIFFGCVGNQKSAPGFCSVLISCCGILSGAWMPLDTMGGLETFCRFLPFYPAVYIGRAITGAERSVVDYLNPVAERYAFDLTAWLGLIPVAVFLFVSVFLALFFFRKNMSGDRK